jgi:hypothetical protein
MRSASSRPIPRRLVSRAAALLVLLALTTRCGFPLSAADLARYENHPYLGYTKAQVFQATVTALKSMGFEIIANDPGNGLIKTSPKVLGAVAYGNQYSAVAVENALGWTIGIQPIPGGIGLHADPRGYSGGTGIPAQNMSGEFLSRQFDSLYAEIEANLPRPK